MRLQTVLIALVLLLARKSPAQQVFDSHVHLWEGEKSLRQYEAEAKTAGIDLVGFGGMWFGGPNQALSGHPDEIRESNDAHFALAKKHQEMLPIATVHPYDGEAAIEEVTRVAALGFKILKLHPHTQKFDPSDPRVLAVVTRAGDLGMIVLVDNFNIIPGDSEKLFNLALAAPRTKFIYAHLGGMNVRFWNVIRAARTAKGLYADNIYFDIAGTTVLLKERADPGRIRMDDPWCRRRPRPARFRLSSIHSRGDTRCVRGTQSHDRGKEENSLSKCANYVRQKALMIGRCPFVAGAPISLVGPGK